LFFHILPFGFLFKLLLNRPLVSSQAAELDSVIFHSSAENDFAYFVPSQFTDFMSGGERK
jgi:hypothetical protein